LKKDLQSAGVTLPVGKPLHLADLQALVQQHGVQTTVEKQKIIQGWEGKPKGILQILWERGLIDELNYKATLTLDGRKNPLTGLIDESMSLHHLLGKCPDFKNELSAVQVLGQDLGVVIDATPKYHAELAGEGIEYSWGHAKGVYRRTVLSQKQGRANFNRLVEKCCDPVEELTLKHVRSMARCMRAYICTYYHLVQPNHNLPDAQSQQNMQQNNNIVQQQKLLFKQIENIVKHFCMHRCALDFD